MGFTHPAMERLILADSTPKSKLRGALSRLFRFTHFDNADDPACLSALDDSTLSRFGYSEREIGQMKDGLLR